MKSLALFAALLCLGGCAALGSNPTPAECTQAQNGLATAQASFQVVVASLSAAQANGAKPDTIARIQADVNVAQVAVNTLQALVNSNCAVVVSPAT